MKRIENRLAAAARVVAILLSGGLAHAQSTVAIPSTGAQRVAGSAQDANWKVISSDIPGETAGGPAPIVTVLPGGWATPASGTGWIAPNAQQDNATRPGTCCQGKATYQVTFNVADPASAVAQMAMAGDEVITAYLNGTDDNHIVYSTDGPTYSSPVSFTLKQGATYVDPGGYSHKVQFIAGTNTLTVEVLNYGGGPTGLYVNTVLPAGAKPSSYTNTAPASGHTDAAEDPVDSGSGQFYDTEIEFQLGGPMHLGFERYYSSQLSAGSVSTALGTNWMGTYDATALVSGTNAQVLLFGGKVVSFTNSAGTWQLVSPKDTMFQFAAAGTGYKFMDPRTQRIYTFSSSGGLTRIEDRNGNALTVTPGTDGPAKVADGLGRALTFTYTGGKLTSVQDQSGRAVTYTYSGNLLASATDPMKGVTQYTYTTVGTRAGLLTKETLPLGNAPTTQTYDSSGRVVAQADPNNNTIKIAYDGIGGTTITDPASNVTRHKNDDIGDISQITDPAGASLFLTYDSAYRRTNVTDKTGNSTRIVYHPQTGYIAAITDALGKTTSYSYTAQTQASFTFYNLSGITYPDGTTASMIYDAAGNLLSMTDADGSTRQYAYDANGRLTQFTDPLNQISTYTWNTDATLVSVKDPLGNVTAFEYDSSKNLAKITDPNGSTAKFLYDGDGRRTVESKPGEPSVTSHFDANGQRDSWVGALGQQYTFTYTATGKVATFTDPQKSAISYTYDTDDRLTKILNGAGEAVALTYDVAGRVASMSDNAGPRYTYTYDAAGRMTSRTDATGRKSTWTYDADGRLTGVTTPGGNVFQFSYDARSNLIGKTNPLGDQYLHTRDAAGRLLGITAPGGGATTIQRDAAGQTVAITSANSNTWKMSWNAIHKLAKLTDPLGNATSYSYTGTRLSKIDYPLGSVTITSNTAGQPTKFEYSDGTVVNRGYDASNFLVSADSVAIKRNSMGLITSMNGIGITVDAVGRPLTLTYATGKVITYSYDATGRVAAVSDWIGGSTTLTYDAASRRATMTFPNAVATTWGYDADGRTASLTYGTLGYVALTRDAAGKITSADRNLPAMPILRDAAQQFSYNAGAQLASATYDAMGRVTGQDSRAYTWNLASQLVSFADNVNSGNVTYDGLGEISSSSASGAAQSYVFNYGMHYPALSIVRQGTDDARYYVYLPSGELLYSIDAASNSRKFYHFDEMGNTVFLTDDSGAVTDTYAITPYGEIADHMGTADNPFTWQGQWGAIQEAPGLYYLRSRHYDASTARFLSPDPVMNLEPQSTEPYVYARGNPLLFRDPFGADSELPTDLGNLQLRLGSVIGREPLTFATDPEYIFLVIATSFVQANPHFDFNTLMKLAYSIVYPPPQAPPATSASIATPPSPAQVGSTGAGLIGQDGAGLIGHDGASLIGHDGASLIGHDGATLIGHDGATLIGQDGAGLIGQDGAGLIGQDGAGLIGQDGAGLIGQDGAGFIPRVTAFRDASKPTKAKNNKK